MQVWAVYNNINNNDKSERNADFFYQTVQLHYQRTILNSNRTDHDFMNMMHDKRVASTSIPRYESVSDYYTQHYTPIRIAYDIATCSRCFQRKDSSQFYRCMERTLSFEFTNRTGYNLGIFQYRFGLSKSERTHQ
jgi:hypothetical protein